MGLPSLLRLRSSHTATSPLDDNQLVRYERNKQPTEPAPFPDGIMVLHDCPDAIVDICFLHGLTGDRESTWTAAGQTEPWPKTLLPSELKRARILTFGYDAAREHASSRPLIFVAHSLGGLVCKQALLHSRNSAETHLRGIFECTKGIIFMGTPHRGSWMANWAHIPVKVLDIFFPTNPKLVQILATDSELLKVNQDQFLSMVNGINQDGSGRRIEMTCFHELLPLRRNIIVVSKDSATFDGYNPVSIHGNHINMIKFASRKDSGFERVKGELRRWEEEIEKNIDGQQQKQQQHQKVESREDSATTPFRQSSGSIPRIASRNHHFNHNTGTIHYNVAEGGNLLTGAIFQGDIDFSRR
ncbi:conserved hypothetical protein [Talaromyces stipitatus ATCC 10500]|uniref:DUF676 domain-containing protein n=1 Tax=Talaromyces stipitatus (strain ATCC 10500 / CBS 375.48 / QM 6759 / NRRL 1006) TaxID=441959 RepID=B8M8S8_TALSN|nr:uncharacterized protein TSTA_038040 [Talaromyces stipitatus ATCC 10500]EED20591.1 conserved hypothetical protein [Talaromyces stipitatus ATCC 10500]